jgi:transposase
MNKTAPTPTLTPAGAPRPRRTYDAAFKQAALAHCQRHGGGLTRTARELGLNNWTLRDWVQADARRQQSPPAGRSLAESEAENARLRAELIRVTEPREILKESLGIQPMQPLSETAHHAQACRPSRPVGVPEGLLPTLKELGGEVLGLLLCGKGHQPPQHSLRSAQVVSQTAPEGQIAVEFL